MRRAVVGIGIGLIAVVALSAMQVLRAHRAEDEGVNLEAAVKRAVPTIEAAIQSALAKSAAESFKSDLQRAQQAGPDAYRQFITGAVATQLKGPRLGHDFTWRGTRYRWPMNPFTGRPMKEGTGPGDFSILFIWYGYVSGQPDAFDLIAYGNDGKPVVTQSHTPSGTPVLP